MALVRIYLVAAATVVQILARLQTKFGLNRTATIIHCIMRVAEQEGITREGILIPRVKSSRRTQDN